MIYFVLFIALVLMPHFSRHIGSVSQAYAESAATVVILGIAYLVYYLHKRELARQKRRLQALEGEIKISQNKLVESFEYIGKVNRRLPLLKELSSDLFANSRPTKRYRKNVFESLLSAAAVSIAKADWGMFRFVDLTAGRTAKEFVHAAKSPALLRQRIGNADLMHISTGAGKPQMLGDLYIVQASDRSSSVRGFLILPNAGSNLRDEYSLLQAITDQAQLFYKYLFV